MKISENTIDEFHQFFEDNSDEIVCLINYSREKLGEKFGENVNKVDEKKVKKELEKILENKDLALNIAALYKIGKDLEIKNDYSGIIVDEIIGKNIAATIAESEPKKTLAEATFHYMDIHYNSGNTEGEDDIISGIAAGLQTRIKGWKWQKEQ